MARLAARRAAVAVGLALVAAMVRAQQPAPVASLPCEEFDPQGAVERGADGCWRVVGVDESAGCELADAVARALESVGDREATTLAMRSATPVPSRLEVRHAGPGRLRLLACGLRFAAAGELGLRVEGGEREAAGVEIVGLQVSGRSVAIEVASGDVTLRGVTLDENEVAMRLLPGARLSALDVEVRGGGDGMVAQTDGVGIDLRLENGSFSDLRGDAIRLSIGGVSENRARVDVEGIAFGPGAAAGLGGRNGIVLQAAGEAHLVAELRDVELRGVPRAAGNTGGISVAAADRARLELVLERASVAENGDAQGVRVVARGDARVESSIRDSAMDAVARQAIYVSGRDRADLTVELTGNRLGVDAPIASGGRAGVEILAEDGSTVRARVGGNEIVASTRQPALRLSAESAGSLAVAVDGNRIRSEGDPIEVATADSATVCLALGVDDLAGRRVRIEPKGGPVTVESRAGIDSRMDVDSALRDHLVVAAAGACSSEGSSSSSDRALAER